MLETTFGTFLVWDSGAVPFWFGILAQCLFGLGSGAVPF
jgi:hypothetical protein